MPPALLFDFDGTLADTAQANYEAYAQALREVGVEIDRESFDRLAFGRNWREFLPGLLSTNGAQAADVALRKTALYGQFAGLIRFNSLLLALIEHRTPGTPLALVTSASARNLQQALGSRPTLLKAFDVTVTGDDVTAHKPDPESYILAARRLGVQARDCIVFEDSDAGVAAGVAFGAQVLRVCRW